LNVGKGRRGRTMTPTNGAFKFYAVKRIVHPTGVFVLLIRTENVPQDRADARIALSRNGGDCWVALDHPEIHDPHSCPWQSDGQSIHAGGTVTAVDYLNRLKGDVAKIMDGGDKNLDRELFVPEPKPENPFADKVIDMGEDQSDTGH